MGNRACMKHQIGLCGAPCIGKQSREDYQATFDNIRRILRGDFSELLAELKKQMYALADALRFEEADAVKQKIHLLEEYQSRSTVVDTNVRDVDVVHILSDERYAYISFLRVKHGAIIYSLSSEVLKQLDESDAELLATAIPSLHQQSQSTATEVVLPIAVPDLPTEYLRQNVDPRGDRRRLLELALRNAESFQKQRRHQRALLNGDFRGQGDTEGAEPVGDETKKMRLLKRLQAALALPSLPMEIECFDNSNIQGAYPVAGMVRFTACKPNRQEYRKFNIKTVEGPDDYASMAEVISRRYSRLHAEGRTLPDLLIVDGGEGQMHIARQVIVDQLHLAIPIAGLAKDDRHRTNELLRFDDEGQIVVVQLKPNDPLFHLMEQIQNEVHRYAITFHKAQRSRGTFRTSLTDIPGIGQTTAHNLLLRFGSVKQVSLQTLDDLAAAIGPAKARLVFDALHPADS